MQETRVIASKISSKYFMWHKDLMTFTTECSILPSGFNPEGQIWNDSCDAGFIMVSDQTGNEIIFCHVDTARTDEGEIQYYIFEADPSYNKKILTEKITLNIFND